MISEVLISFLVFIESSRIYFYTISAGQAFIFATRNHFHEAYEKFRLAYKSAVNEEPRSEILTEIFGDKPIKILIGSILLNYGYLKVSYVKEREREIKRGEQLVYFLTSLIDPRTALEFVHVLYGACAAGLPALRFEIARTVVVGISIGQTLQKFFREFFVKDENSEETWKSLSVTASFTISGILLATMFLRISFAFNTAFLGANLFFGTLLVPVLERQKKNSYPHWHSLDVIYKYSENVVHGLFAFSHFQ